MITGNILTFHNSGKEDQHGRVLGDKKGHGWCFYTSIYFRIMYLIDSKLNLSWTSSLDLCKQLHHAIGLLSSAHGENCKLLERAQMASESILTLSPGGPGGPSLPEVPCWERERERENKGGREGKSSQIPNLKMQMHYCFNKICFHTISLYSSWPDTRVSFLQPKMWSF